MAEADSIADTIAFEVNQAYRQLIAARKDIDRSRPAVEQTLETYRLVVARTRQGDATPAELTDAQAAVTRAQQDYFNAIYDYLTTRAVGVCDGLHGCPGQTVAAGFSCHSRAVVTLAQKNPVIKW